MSCVVQRMLNPAARPREEDKSESGYRDEPEQDVQYQVNCWGKLDGRIPHAEPPRVIGPASRQSRLS